jgi:hypothetical protein
MEGSGRDIIKVLSRYLAGGIEENHENLDRMTGFLAET